MRRRLSSCVAAKKINKKWLEEHCYAKVGEELQRKVHDGSGSAAVFAEEQEEKERNPSVRARLPCGAVI